MISPQKTMSFWEHVHELRSRLISIGIIWLAGTCVMLFFSKGLFHFLMQPLLREMPASSKIIVLSPLEGWIAYLKAAFLCALLLTAPLWCYQIWAFFAPALAEKERRKIVIASLLSGFLFAAGTLFGYLIILPAAFHYLVVIYEKTEIALLPQMQWYISFLFRAIVAFGIVFETPLILVFLSYLGITTVDRLRRARRFVIVSIFIFAAIITPGPDVLSQIAVAIPLIIFYEIGIVAAIFMNRKKQTAVVSSPSI